MKYKLIAIFLILFLILGCGIFNVYYEEELSYVYHQHLEDSSDESGCYGIDNCSHLPIVNINTNGQDVPGVDHNKENYIITDVNIYDNGDEVNSLSDSFKSYKARIRYRGRSSIYFDKKGYLLKFINEKNEKVNESFLGMPSDSNWVLHGPYIDKTLIRNYMWYNIGQEIMGQSPKTRFFELYLDGEYQGVYVAAESVTQSEKSRVVMDSIRKDSIATSYLILLDADSGNEVTYLNSFSKYTTRISSLGKYPGHLTIKYPNDEDLTEEVREYIYNDFAKFEKMLYSLDYKDYKNYIDIDSFVDYLIINEFTQNYDIGAFSTYIYKDVNGKYKMYLWDFNSANNNYLQNFLDDGQKFNFQNTLWYDKLMKDPDFTEAIIKRYEELRKSYLSEEYLFNYIDSTILYLGDAVDRNYEVWGYTFDSIYSEGSTHVVVDNYEEAVLQLKDAIHRRGEWMDKNIYTLKQYSHESVNKKYNK